MDKTVLSVKSFAEKHNMLKKRHIIAAVSGGTDSMALLDILLKLRDFYGYELSAMHFNHGIRGEEALRDEAFVKRYCESIGIPCVIGRGDTLNYAKENRIGTEEAGRILRYGFFDETAKSLNADCVATAHNADDNAETVLMNMARGSGALGMCGIPPVRDIYIRPILCLTRENIEEYSERNELPHVEDSTNGTDEYTRNRVRHNIIPLLREINGGFPKNVLEMAELLRNDEAFLQSAAEDFLNEHLCDNRISRSMLKKAPLAIASRAIRRLCPNADSSHIEAILRLCEDNSSPSAMADIPGMRVRREYEYILFGENEYAEKSFEEISISTGEKITVEELSLNITCDDIISKGNIDKTFTTFVFQKDKICGKILIRRRRAGDRIALSGGSKTLKKLFIDRKIPETARDSIPVIEINGEVAGVYSVASSVNYAAKTGEEAVSVAFSEIENEK